MVRHTFKILQQLLQNFKKESNHFGITKNAWFNNSRGFFCSKIVDLCIYLRFNDFFVFGFVVGYFLNFFYFAANKKSH